MRNIYLASCFFTISHLTISKLTDGPALELGLTDHFISFLNESNYEFYGFNKTEFYGGSYGGKISDEDSIINQPVVFVHGNGDLAAGRDEDLQSGFKYSIQYFLSKGYKRSELYATTWGYGDVPHELQHYHADVYLIYVRKFIDAVLEYTNAT